MAAPPATPRHPNHSLPLLPSGPGGVCKLSSRGNRRGHRRLLRRARNRGVRNYCKTGGEGGIRTRETGISRLHTFQACSFNHSDTSPQLELSTPGGIVRPIPGPHPRFARASLSAVQIRSRRICRTRETGISRLHTFQACSFNHSDTSPHRKNRVSVRYAGAEDTRGAQWVQAKRIAVRLRRQVARIAACCIHERRLSGGHGALATMNLSSANPPCRIRP